MPITSLIARQHETILTGQARLAGSSLWATNLWIDNHGIDDKFENDSIIEH